MTWPAWLWLGSRLKLSLWLGNRIATWTGLYYFWKRFRARRDFWVWCLVINLVSLAVLGGVLYWIWLRASVTHNGR